MSSDLDEESSEHEEIPIIDIPVTIEVKADNIEDVSSTIERPQRTKVLPARLQDCKVVGDDEVTPDGDLVHLLYLQELNQSTRVSP